MIVFALQYVYLKYLYKTHINICIINSNLLIILTNYTYYHQEYS